MLTWTTYGTWLQGGEKGFVKRAQVRGENAALKMDCKEKLKGSPVRLRRKEQNIVREAILEASKRFKQNMRAIAVCSNHVHIVCEYVEVPIGVLVGYYKNAGRKALQESGYKGKVWTSGYDKRFCFDRQALRAKVKYVEGHR